MLQAYVVLENRGLVETRPQSGHYVRRPASVPPPEPRSARESTQATRVTVSDLVARVYGSARHPDIVQLGAAHLSPALLPADNINRRLAALARSAGGAGVVYDLPPGLPALRRQIARRAPEWGVVLGPDDLVTTIGAMEALHLALRAVATAGDTIAIESPAYYGLLQLVESLGMKALEIPSNASTGIDLPLLERALGQHRVKACIVVTNFSNPLGALMPDDAKRELVEMLARRDIPLIEDDILRRPPLRRCPSAARESVRSERARHPLLVVLEDDRSGVSRRVHGAGPLPRAGRAAEVRADDRDADVAADGHRRFPRARRLRSSPPPPPKKARRAGASREQRHAIAASFPQGTRIFSRPRGGFVLWVEMPAGTSALDLHARALAHGIAIAPGPIFSAKQRFSNCIRVSCGAVWSDTIDRSIRTLGRLATAS